VTVQPLAPAVLKDAITGRNLSKMTSGIDHRLGNRKDDLLAVLAKINEYMMWIRKSVESNPAVVAATRGCDVRRYRDFMTEEEEYCFEA
jgi:hypothetical protein